MQQEEILSVEITIAKDNEQKDNTIEDLEKRIQELTKALESK